MTVKPLYSQARSKRGDSSWIVCK